MLQLIAGVALAVTVIAATLLLSAMFITSPRHRWDIRAISDAHSFFSAADDIILLSKREMTNLMFDKTTGKALSSSAFILYRPQSEGVRELLFYNEEAQRVIFFPVPQAEILDPSADISALCVKWKKMFDKSQETAGGHGSETGIIDLIQSGRRRYTVRVVVLTNTSSLKQYLFILERMNPEKINLSIAFRNLGLNRREQEMVRLLLAGLGNKEIADSLGLSLNTVKGYMKLLSRKLGANNRAGIIAAILGAHTENKVLPTSSDDSILHL